MEMLKDTKIEELFEYLETYRNSLSEEKEIEDVEELITYYAKQPPGSDTISEAGNKFA